MTDLERELEEEWRQCRRSMEYALEAYALRELARRMNEIEEQLKRLRKETSQ